MPIVPYGSPILRKQCSPVDKNYDGLDKLIENMWHTLENANGSGLATPQINLPIRIFIIDSETSFNTMNPEERKVHFEGDNGIREVFINPEITEYSEAKCDDLEGCLSIPGVAAIVSRPYAVKIEYYDRNFQKHTKAFNGLTARIIQHEFDHIEGRLYLDYLSSLKMKLLTKKLAQIKKGRYACEYPMRRIK
ncbi:peptide deformylase [Chitinophaga pinensis DSM 2588]|uniref:Peptide deformylase n=2 Tax=Chitinophaga pinensis TaxID=79329 RepID=A0A979G896_CHIPD|nr:peptide deformylase [Chitinophaga pinensis DSM 2588]